MKKLSALALSALSVSFVISVEASPKNQNVYQRQKPTKSVDTVLFLESRATQTQQNLMGEVSAIDQSAGKITVKTATGGSVSVSIGDKTVFRRIQPGQTSLTNAETIAITDIKVGDRVLVPGGVVGDTPAKQVVVIAREALTARTEQEREARRARTINGRITAVDAQKQEIIIQSRGGGRANAEALIIAASGNVKLRRYAPDSLKVTDAVPASFADLRVGDQIRVVGDRSTDGLRVTAEEIVAGSVTRTVGIISEINAGRGEVVVKNSQTGQLMTVALGKNTTLRRISPEVAETLKQIVERRTERRNERAANNPGQPASTPTPGQNGQPRNRGERRNRAGGGTAAAGGAQQNANRNPQQLFENLPLITVAELKKGDAVLITGTSTGTDNTRMMAVSIITGDAELQQALQRTQGGRNNSSNMSPGLPGNVSGSNPGSDDEPRK